MGSTNLNCINVDDITYSALTWTAIEPQNIFDTNCNNEFWECINDNCIQQTSVGSFLTIAQCQDSCGTSIITEKEAEEPKLLKIVNSLGKSCKPLSSGLYFYIYENGKVEKRFLLNSNCISLKN